MNYTGLKFDGGIYHKGCECKVIKQLVDWDDVYKAHQDFGYSFKKIQDNYLVRCCGKNSIWSEEEIKEMTQPKLQESIKRILREESRGQKKLKGLVDEFGLFKVSKMIGISVTKLAEVTNIPIDSGTANQILVEMMNNDELKTKYKDFEIHVSSNDVFYWEAMVKTGHFHDDMIENITVAATPFWDGVKYTPVELEWYTLLNYYGVTVYEISPEGGFYKELKHQTNFESVDELLNWYEEFYLPEVYNLAMNTLVPKMHKLADYEIKQRG
jgi:hypothetical protein